MAVNFSDPIQERAFREKASQYHSPSEIDAYINKKKGFQQEVSLYSEGKIPFEALTPATQEKYTVEAAKSGLGIPATKEENILSKSGAAINELLSSFSQIPDELKGPVVGRTVKNIPTSDPIRAQAKAYEKARQGLASTIKSVVGESGVLTDKDIERIVGLTPTINQTPEESSAQIEQLKKFLSSQGVEVGQELPDLVDTNQSNLSQQPPILAEQTTQQPSLPDLSKINISPGVEGALPVLQLRKGLKPFEDIVNTFSTQLGDLYEEQKKQVTDQEAGKFWAAIEGAMPIVEFTKVGEGGKITELDRTAVKAAGEVGLLLLAPKIIEKISGPLRSVEQLSSEREAFAKASNAQISGDKLLSDTVKGLKNISPADRRAVNKSIEQAVGEYTGKTLTTEDALELYKQVNKAFSASGKAGKSAKAAFNLSLRDAIREQMPTEVIKATDLLAKRFKLGKLAKKIFNPFTIGSAVTGGLVSRAVRKQ